MKTAWDFKSAVCDLCPFEVERKIHKVKPPKNCLFKSKRYREGGLDFGKLISLYNSLFCIIFALFELTSTSVISDKNQEMK